MMKVSKSLVAGSLAIALVSGGVGVYAGTVIDSYKSPRGHIVTVEPVNVHKNRIGISVNGKQLKTTTWYADGVSYAPIREVAEMLGASVNYNPKTVSGDIVTTSKLLDLLGIKLHVPYAGVQTPDQLSISNPTRKVNFTITSFNPSTNLFEGKYEDTRLKKTFNIKGRISENKIEFSNPDKPDYNYELTYNLNDKKYTGVINRNGYLSDKLTISLE